MAQKPTSVPDQNSENFQNDQQVQDLPDFFIFDPETSGIEPDDVAEFPEDFPDYVPNAGVITQDEISIHTKREDTRGRLAILYTVCTFLMFVLGVLVSILDAAWRQVSIVQNLSTVLPLISGIFLGTLGFVLGYYFRKVEDGE